VAGCAQSVVRLPCTVLFPTGRMPTASRLPEWLPRCQPMGGEFWKCRAPNSVRCNGPTEGHVMVAAAEASDYLGVIREKVCSHCVERPAGGPPCGPLGKPCGIELHLPQLIDAIHEVHSRRIDPYLEHNQEKICAHCALLRTSCCPCPMESLAVL